MILLHGPLLILLFPERPAYVSPLMAVRASAEPRCYGRARDSVILIASSGAAQWG